MLASSSRTQKLLDQNAELEARLKVLERIDAQRLEENRKLKAELERVTERAVLLEEEVRWLKSQFFGRSTQQDLTEANPDQRLLFNEAEVLAAMQAAEAELAVRKTKVEAHERRHTC